MKSTLPLIILLTTFFFCVFQSRLVQVPPISSDSLFSLRWQSVVQLDDAFTVFNPLQKIYKKEVYQLVNGSQKVFNECEQVAPEVTFTALAYRKIGQQANSPTVIHEFDKIKYSHSLIDLISAEGKLYYLMSNGVLKIDTFTPGYSDIKPYEEIKTAQVKVNDGGFIKLVSSDGSNRCVLFLNSNQSFYVDLNTKSMKQITSYSPISGFETVIALDNNFFAVAYGQAGMRIYSLNFINGSVKFESEINGNNSGVLNFEVVDLAYDSQRKILFILDRTSGVLSLQLIYYNGTLKTQLTSSAIKNSLCNLIYYDLGQDELYLSCRQLHKYKINNWPVISEKVVPKPDISMRQITSSSAVTAFVGRDIFEIIYAQRKAAVFRDKLLDKLILDGSYFISANEYGILLGNYNITPPSLQCIVESSSNIGTHKLVLKATAECNSAYFQTIKFYPQKLTRDDKCIYTVYQNVQIWQPAVFNYAVFVIALVALLVLGFGILVWWLYSRWQVRKLEIFIDRYQQVGDGQQIDGNKEFVQRKSSDLAIEMSESKASEPSGKDQKHQQLNQEIEQPNQHLHDIQ